MDGRKRHFVACMMRGSYAIIKVNILAITGGDLVCVAGENLFGAIFYII